MSYRERREARRRRNAVEQANTAAEADGLEPITPADLRVIELALEDRMRDKFGTPAGEAAEQVRAKIARNRQAGA